MPELPISLVTNQDVQRVGPESLLSVPFVAAAPKSAMLEVANYLHRLIENTRCNFIALMNILEHVE